MGETDYIISIFIIATPNLYILSYLIAFKWNKRKQQLAIFNAAGFKMLNYFFRKYYEVRQQNMLEITDFYCCVHMKIGKPVDCHKTGNL